MGLQRKSRDLQGEGRDSRGREDEFLMLKLWLMKLLFKYFLE